MIEFSVQRKELFLCILHIKKMISLLGETMLTRLSAHIKKNVSNFSLLFTILAAIGICCSMISIIATNGRSLNNLLFDNRRDVFMDFYNTLSDNAMGKVFNNNIYPAFAVLITDFINLFVPHDVAIQGGAYLRTTQVGNMVFIMFTIISFLNLSFLLFKYKSGSEFERYLFVIIILLSCPFIYLIERANIIILSLIFSIIFIFNYDSDNKYIKQLSFICLSMAAAIKIYPCILGVVLIKDKKYKEATRLVIYGVAFFFLPFFFYDGVGSLKSWIDSFSSNGIFQYIAGYGHRVDLSNTLKFFYDLFKYQWVPPLGETIITGVVIINAILCIICVFLTSSKWKTVMLLSLMTLFLPAFTFTYNLIFLVPALMIFLDSKEKRHILDYVYLALFLLIFIPFNYGEVNLFPSLYGFRPVTLSNYIERITLIFFQLILFLDIFITTYKQRTAE